MAKKSTKLSPRVKLQNACFDNPNSKHRVLMRRVVAELDLEIERAEREANRPYNVFSSRQRSKFFGRVQNEVGRYVGRMMGPSEQAVSLAEGEGSLIVDGKKILSQGDTFSGREIKSILGESKSLIPFRADIRCKIEERRAFAAAYHWLLSNVPPPDVLKFSNYLIEGIKSGWREYLPGDVVDIYDSYLKPSKGLASYDKGIILTTDISYLEISPNEYDDAFQLACWTNGDVKYALNTAWLRALPACNPETQKVRSAA